MSYSWCDAPLDR